MPLRIAVVHNQPDGDRYSAMGEDQAVAAVMEAVEAVHQSLAEMGYSVVRVPLHPPLSAAREKLLALRHEADAVFNLFEGFDGKPDTEAEIAGVLSGLSLPFTGCPPHALALALDKVRTKQLLSRSGLDTPHFQVLCPPDITGFNLRFPCIVKPLGEDASHGINEDSVVDNTEALGRQVSVVASNFGGRALVEEFVEGREFNAAVMGNRDLEVLPVSEIVYNLPPGLPKFLPYAAKWTPGSPYFEHTPAVCPAEADSEIIAHLSDTARRAFRLLGCRGYARVDMRLGQGDKVFVLEVNPNPDIAPGTGAARQASAAGMTYPLFVERILRLALERE
ncbi:MAG: ATP-grasp domain-containing protein [Chloroflexi bacterium]|nr:ATP-grasp domain-containing protein [Chloroflexota bacterium]